MRLVSLRNNCLFEKSKKMWEFLKFFHYGSISQKWVTRSGTLGGTQDATGGTHLVGGTGYPRLRTLLVIPGGPETCDTYHSCDPKSKARDTHDETRDPKPRLKVKFYFSINFFLLRNIVTAQVAVVARNKTKRQEIT